MSGLGGLGCGALSDLDGMITGVVPVRRSEVAHELHVKWPGSAREVRSADMLSHHTMQHQKSPASLNMTDVSRQKVCGDALPTLSPCCCCACPTLHFSAAPSLQEMCTWKPGPDAHVRSVLCPIGQSLLFHCLVPQ